MNLQEIKAAAIAASHDAQAADQVRRVKELEKKHSEGEYEFAQSLSKFIPGITPEFFWEMDLDDNDRVYARYDDLLLTSAGNCLSVALGYVCPRCNRHFAVEGGSIQSVISFGKALELKPETFLQRHYMHDCPAARPDREAAAVAALVTPHSALRREIAAAVTEVLRRHKLA